MTTESNQTQKKRQKTGGRKASNEVLYATTIKQAATVCGCTPEQVKLAREMGCTAFTNANRISIAILKEFLQTPEFIEACEELDESEDWKKRLDKAKALTAETKLKILKGEFCALDRVRQLITAGDRAMMDTLRRYMENEQPPLVEGKSADKILAINKKWMDEVISDMRDSRYKAMTELSTSLPDEESED